MGVLQRFEQRLEHLVTGAFARTFRSAVQPVEVAAALQREVDNAAQILSRDRRLAPNDFTVDHLTRSGSDNAATAPITLTNADAWAFSLTGAHVFVGVGGSLTASASASGYDVVDGTIGLTANASSFKLASITQGSTTYTGLQVRGLNGDLVGIPGVIVHVTGVTALANLVSSSTATRSSP